MLSFAACSSSPSDAALRIFKLFGRCGESPFLVCGQNDHDWQGGSSLRAWFHLRMSGLTQRKNGRCILQFLAFSSWSSLWFVFSLRSTACRISCFGAVPCWWSRVKTMRKRRLYFFSDNKDHWPSAHRWWQHQTFETRDPASGRPERKNKSQRRSGWKGKKL